MKKEVETIPVMANTVPWNEAVLRGLRKCKTLHFNWSHRGPMYLYNSKGRPDRDAAKRYGIDSDAQPTGVIVGIVDVARVDVGAGEWLVWLENPRRFAVPIPYTPPRGSIRISRAPVALGRRRRIDAPREKR